tara:strand:- start:355 stop:573 length:219 start_codon:yes stop_codon:yes gene_type:complete
MSKLSERCEERKKEAQALADKFNSLTEEGKKIENERIQVKKEFDVKSAQYAELLSQIKEEEGAKEVINEIIE